MELCDYYLKYMNALCEGTLAAPEGIALSGETPEERAMSLQAALKNVSVPDFVRRCARAAGRTRRSSAAAGRATAPSRSAAISTTGSSLGSTLIGSMPSTHSASTTRCLSRRRSKTRANPVGATVESPACRAKKRATNGRPYRLAEDMYIL